MTSWDENTIDSLISNLGQSLWKLVTFWLDKITWVTIDVEPGEIAGTCDILV